jgi:NADH-quinone oxidoreductase subunit M
MTALLTLAAVAVSYGEQNSNLKRFHILVLSLESLLIALFSTADIFMFYVLLQLILTVAFVLLGIFAKDSICASKFFVILSAGAIFILGGVIYLVDTSGITEIDVLSKYTFTLGQERVIFSLFFIGFACQSAIFPLHVWAPDSHTKPPTSISILLSGILLKIGAFGMITILLPIAKNSEFIFRGYIFAAAVVTMLYAALSMLLQKDLKKIIAYVSIVQMAIIAIGIFSGDVDGISGAFFSVIANSLATTTLLIIVGVVENRFGTRNLNISGVSQAIPYISPIAFVSIMALASVPPTPCFSGNLLILFGCWPNNYFTSVVICFLIVFGVVYGLKIYWKVFEGECKLKKSKLTNGELGCLLPLVALMVVVGVYPDKIIHSVKGEISKILMVKS